MICNDSHFRSKGVFSKGLLALVTFTPVTMTFYQGLRWQTMHTNGIKKKKRMINY